MSISNQLKVTLPSATLSLLLGTTAIADTSFMQLDNDGILQNESVKVGINRQTGSFGSGKSNSPGILFDPDGGGSFDTSYDFLTPGVAFDGQSIKIDGTNYRNNNSSSRIGITASSDLVNELNTLTWNGSLVNDSSTWLLKNTFKLDSGNTFVDVTTTITAGADADTVYYSKHTDPDSQGDPGDSNLTDNVIGYSGIPDTNIAIGEATVSGYAIGISTTDTNTTAGIQNWSTQADAYDGTIYTDDDGNSLNYGNGDNTIGLSWLWTDVKEGDTLTSNYAYILGESIFDAIEDSEGSGGGADNDWTVEDIGSATEAAIAAPEREAAEAEAARIAAEEAEAARVAAEEAEAARVAAEEAEAEAARIAAAEEAARVAAAEEAARIAAAEEAARVAAAEEAARIAAVEEAARVAAAEEAARLAASEEAARVAAEEEAARVAAAAEAARVAAEEEAARVAAAAEAARIAAEEEAARVAAAAEAARIAAEEEAARVAAAAEAARIAAEEAEAARIAAEEAEAARIAAEEVAEVAEETAVISEAMVMGFGFQRAVLIAPLVMDTSNETITSTTETQSTTLPVLTSNIIKHDSTVDNNLQTISKENYTLVTTPMDVVTNSFVRTTETYDDGSEVVTDGDTTTTTVVRNDIVKTSSNIESVVGRVDQVEQLLGIDIHRNMDINNGITVTKTNHKMNNGYNAETNVYSVGIEDIGSNDNILFGVEYNEVNTTMTGSDSNGNMKTHAYRIDIGKSFDNNDTKLTTSFNHTTSDISYSRTIGNYAAGGETTSTDNYASIMLEEETGNVRPFVGYTIGNRKTQGYTETGNVLAVLDYTTESDTYNYATVGFNIDYGIINASIRKDFDTYNTTSIDLDINKSVDDKINLMLGFNRNISNYDTSDSVTAGLSWTF
jgi:hypothetical protein